MTHLVERNAWWLLMRGTGVTALCLLTVALVLGIATTGRAQLGALPRFVTVALHRSLSLLGVVFIALHVVSALLDPYAAVRVVDVVVPLTAHPRTLWVGLGALALDLLAAVVLTSLVRVRLGLRAWRVVHWAAYAIWPVVLVHSLGIGSDARTWWFRATAGVATLAVAGALVWRVGRRTGEDKALTPVRGRRRAARAASAAGRAGR